ncbi:DinB family protein [Granulicella paludicola]|jgi:uncharacterized damage-inducible protein DinB|uniref:DinB family protein n=1 Tax=Granulicella paludicola TaxID=474951 RepID=UPI0021E0C5A6|nr:DinB family protein [Granulicella paludicola]
MTTQVEPWLRGTLTEVEPVRRAVLHALELAVEDAERWVVGLSEVEIVARPHGLPSVAFQLRHMARSLDRLLTYAEGKPLDETQLAALGAEMGEGGSAGEALAEFRNGLMRATERVLAASPASFADARGVGRKGLPTTVAGLLIHCADHTQRHSGQMVTTAKVVLAARP